MRQARPLKVREYFAQDCGAPLWRSESPYYRQVLPTSLQEGASTPRCLRTSRQPHSLSRSIARPPEDRPNPPILKQGVPPSICEVRDPSIPSTMQHATCNWHQPRGKAQVGAVRQPVLHEEHAARHTPPNYWAPMQTWCWRISHCACVCVCVVPSLSLSLFLPLSSLPLSRQRNKPLAGAGPHWYSATMVSQIGPGICVTCFDYKERNERGDPLWSRARNPW